MSNYKTTQDYVPGKKNPFSSLTTEETINNTQEENNNQVTNSNKSETSNSNTNVTEDQEQTGYLPDKGKK